MANAGLKDEDTNLSLPRIHNAVCFPDLTVFGPEIASELYPICGSLGWKISIQADADRVPVFNYCIVEENHQNGNAVNILKPGDWITLINGTSTTDKDETFFEKVKTACCNQEEGLSLVIKTPAEQQEFHLWDPKPVNIDIKTRRKILPFTLEIFYPDLNDTGKTFALVHKIQQQKPDLKGLKRGDKVIAINDHQLQNKAYKELEQITSQLNKQQQLKLTVERRQWRQNGYLTKSAINRPTYLIWRPLQAELKKKKMTKKLGFKIKCVENPLEQPCIIITHIFAGEKPAAMSPYLNPGCKIMEINGQGLRGLSFEKVKAMLQRAPASVMLTIQEPTCLLHGKRFCPSGGRYTWPVEVERVPLYKSISEGQFPLANGQYICSMCSHTAAGENIASDAQATPLSVVPQPGAESGSIQNGQEFKDISPVATTPTTPQPRGSDKTGSAVRDSPSSSTRYGSLPEMSSLQHDQGLKDTTAVQTTSLCSSPRPEGYAVQPTGYNETRSATWNGPSSSTRHGGPQEMGTVKNGQELKDTSAAQTTSLFTSSELAGCNDQPTGYNEIRSATSNGPSSSTRYGGTQEMEGIQHDQGLKDTTAVQTTSLCSSPRPEGYAVQPTGYNETRSATWNGPSSSTRHGGPQEMGTVQNGQELKDTSAAQTTSLFICRELAGCNDQPTGYNETRSATSNGPNTRYGGTQEMEGIQHGQGLKDTTAVQTSSLCSSPRPKGHAVQPTGYNETRSATWNDLSSSTRYGGIQEMGTIQYNGQELKDTSTAQTTSLFTSPEPHVAGCNDQPTGYDKTRSAMCSGATSTTRFGSLEMSSIQNDQEFKDAEKKPSLDGRLPNSPLPLPLDHGTANGATIDCGLRGIQESGTPLSLLAEPCETPKDQVPVCQNCLTSIVTGKREQSIEQVPGTIYYFICMRLDKENHFFRDYRIMGEKLGFARPEISLLANQPQPTDCLVNEWIARKGKKATVSVFMEILSEMERQELLELLQSWTETCAKCFEKQQKNVRESYV